MLTEGKPIDTRIRDTRIKYGLTQQQVSDLTGIPKRTIQNWEAGVRSCPEYVTKMVTDILNQKFGTPDHQMFLEELLEMLQSDLKHAGSEETLTYISNLIYDINEQLHK